MILSVEFNVPPDPPNHNAKNFILILNSVEFLSLCHEPFEFLLDFLLCWISHDHRMLNTPQFRLSLSSFSLSKTEWTFLVSIVTNSAVYENNSNCLSNYVFVYTAISWALVVESQSFDCITYWKLKLGVVGVNLLEHTRKFNALLHLILLELNVIQHVLDHFSIDIDWVSWCGAEDHTEVWVFATCVWYADWSSAETCLGIFMLQNIYCPF